MRNVNLKDNAKRLITFCIAFVLPMIYYRTLVALFYSETGSPIKRLTGLSVHHFHYGVVFMTIALLLLIFHKQSRISISLAGVGLGLTLDVFAPSLLLQTLRSKEIAAYKSGFAITIVVFLSVMAVAAGMSYWQQLKNSLFNCKSKPG